MKGFEAREKTIEEDVSSALKEAAQWNGDKDNMWSNIDLKLDKERKWWRKKIKIHFIVLAILLGLLAFIILVID